MDLVAHDEPQICTYVHGCLYSLLARPSMRQTAEALNLDAVIKAQISVSDEALRRQLAYISDQLTSTTLGREGGE